MSSRHALSAIHTLSMTTQTSIDNGRNAQKPLISSQDHSMRLFDLPREIRDLIYSWAFTAETGNLGYRLNFAEYTLVAFKSVSHFATNISRLGLPKWLYSNKQTMMEGIEQFAQDRTFSFETCSSEFDRRYFYGTHIASPHLRKYDQFHILSAIRSLDFCPAMLGLFVSKINPSLPGSSDYNALDALELLMSQRDRDHRIPRPISLFVTWYHYVRMKKISSMLGEPFPISDRLVGRFAKIEILLAKVCCLGGQHVEAELLDLDGSDPSLIPFEQGTTEKAQSWARKTVAPSTTSTHRFTNSLMEWSSEKLRLTWTTETTRV